MDNVLHRKSTHFIYHISQLFSSQSQSQMSLEIRPLTALYPPPPHTKNVLYRAAKSISALCGRRGWFAHAYDICAHFYCISPKKKYMGGGGYNAEKGLILRDIAGYVQKVIC